MDQMEARIRKADARDFPVLYEIGLATPEIQVTEGEAFMEQAEFLRIIQAESSILLVAVVNEVVAGFVYVRLDDIDALPGWACLVYLVVRPEFRGQGVGTALYRAAEHLAQERGYSNFYAWARCGQDSPIRKLLMHQGYSEGHKYSWMGKRQLASVTPVAVGSPGLKGSGTTNLAWDCDDEFLKRLGEADLKTLKRVISGQVLASLQYHSTSDDLDHVLIYMSDDAQLVVDLQLPGCIRTIDLREVVASEIDIRGRSPSQNGRAFSRSRSRMQGSEDGSAAFPLSVARSQRLSRQPRWGRPAAEP